jgi:hypothetical protein
MQSILDVAIDFVAIFVQRAVMKVCPILRQQVVVEYVDEDIGSTSALRRYPSAAAAKVRMRFGVFINSAIYALHRKCQL